MSEATYRGISEQLAEFSWVQDFHPGGHLKPSGRRPDEAGRVAPQYAAERNSVVENEFERIGLAGEVKNKMPASAATAHEPGAARPRVVGHMIGKVPAAVPMRASSAVRFVLAERL